MHKYALLSIDAMLDALVGLTVAQVVVIVPELSRSYLDALELVQYKVCFEFGLRSESLLIKGRPFLKVTSALR